MNLSIKIYVGLVLLLSVLTALTVFLPQGDLPSLAEQDLPASRTVIAMINAVTVLVLYGGLGLLGLFLARRLGFAEIWDAHVTNRQRFLQPIWIGGAIGVFFIVADVALNQFHSLGPLPHPPFPTSLVASMTAGIGEEIIFRLFFVSFWVWLVSKIILKGRFREPVFWVVTVFSALAFAAGHLPTMMIIFDMGSIQDVPLALLAEIFLLNGVLSVFVAVYFRKYGFLSAVGIHFWTDVVWHVMWGAL
jgi:hypothetical protein